MQSWSHGRSFSVRKNVGNHGGAQFGRTISDVELLLSTPPLALLVSSSGVSRGLGVGVDAVATKRARRRAGLD